jgi:hypothetical protein
MGLCNSKKSSYIEPSIGSQNIINLYKKADKDIVISSIQVAQNFIDDETLKKEYYYIRKLIIVSAFLRELPVLFNGNYVDMKKFLDRNKLPTNVYDMIYKYNNKIETSINKYPKINTEDIADIDKSDENIINALSTIRSYIYDIILI